MTCSVPRPQFCPVISLATFLCYCAYLSCMAEPRPVEGFVSFEEEAETPALKRPHEAESLALSLLGAASEARAQREREKAYRERTVLVAALLKHESEQGSEVGVTSPAPEYEEVDASGTRWRLVWCESARFGRCSWHVPAGFVAGWIPERPKPWGEDHTPTEEKLAALAEWAGCGAAVEHDAEPSRSEPPKRAES